MTEPGPSRRDFLSTAGTAMGGAWLFGLDPAIAAARTFAKGRVGQGLPYDTFTQAEGDDFEAFSARIIPTDDTPGAREAGCVHFADRALGSFMSDMLPIIRDGLVHMNQIVAELHPGRTRFIDLDPAQQDAVITLIETEPTPFFFFAKSLVMIGFSGDPSYGGNQDRIGWNHMGFETDFAYLPPFGYYDRNEHGEQDPDATPAPPSHDHTGGDR